MCSKYLQLKSKQKEIKENVEDWWLWTYYGNHNHYTTEEHFKIIEKWQYFKIKAISKHEKKVHDFYNQTRITTFITTKFNISDEQMNINNYGLAANITEYHIISKLMAESRILLMEHKYPPPLFFVFMFILF